MNAPNGQTSDNYPNNRRSISDYSSFEINVNTERGTSSTHKYISWLILAAYSIFLVYRALSHKSGGDAADIPVWELQDSHQLLVLIGSFLFRGFCEFAYFVPVGFITAMVFSHHWRWCRRLPIIIPALMAGSMLVIMVRAIEIDQSWHWAGVVSLVLPLVGCLFGTWMGTTWFRGRRARLWLLPKIALLALLIALCSGIILWLIVEEKPLPFDAARVTSAEKRRLVHLIRSKSPRYLIEGQTQTLRLTEHDINVLLSWGLSLGSQNRKAKVSLERDLVLLSVSIGVAPGGGKTRYFNLEMAGRSEIEREILNLDIDRCRLGSLEVPQWFLNLVSPVVISQLRHDRLLKPFLDAARAVAIEPDSIAVTYGPLHLPPHGFREELFGPAGSGEEVLASTRAQVEHLLAVISQSPDKQPVFNECVENAFALARIRSIDGRDPVIENRAAIFSLGMLLGHPRVEEFLGPVNINHSNHAARRILSRVVLRGRPDWTKHFCVAAAIALLSDEIVSDAASLLKEELDSDIGGSGFSFSDILASRAGTTFALWATRNEEEARAMQDRIVRGFKIDDFFPPAADLPEGITDAELQTQYGGVGGEGYRRVIEEIERRIATCPAYN